MRTNKELAVELGANIKAARAKIGITQRRLATESGITYVYLCLIETGKAVPKLPVVERIAARLGTTTAALLKSAARVA